MIDVDGKEAAGVVVGVEERQLLVAVHGIAGVVDVQRDGGGRGGKAAAEEIDQGGRHARHLDARGRVLQSAHGGLGAERAAALRRLPCGQLEQRVRAQCVAVVGILIPAGDRQHAKAQHGRERVDHLRLIAPVADTACQGLGEAYAALRLAQQDEAAVRRDQAAIEGGAHLLALHAWQIEGEKAIVGHGGRGVFVNVRRGRRSDNEFLPDGNGLRYVRHPKIRPDTNNPG